MIDYIQQLADQIEQSLIKTDVALDASTWNGNLTLPADWKLYRRPFNFARHLAEMLIGAFGVNVQIDTDPGRVKLTENVYPETGYTLYLDGQTTQEPDYYSAARAIIDFMERTTGSGTGRAAKVGQAPEVRPVINKHYHFYYSVNNNASSDIAAEFELMKRMTEE